MKYKFYAINLLKLLSVLICAISVSACGNKETLTVASNSTNLVTPIQTPKPARVLMADWQYRWLKSAPCKPPCWEGVTPGLTTAEDAIGILQKSPLVRDANLPKDYLSEPSLGFIGWKGIEHSTDGMMSFNTKAKVHTVDMLELFQVPVKFGEVVQSYGYPAYVLARVNPDVEDSRVSYQLRVIYPSLGFYLNASRGSRLDISTDSVFDTLVFFDPKVDVLTDKNVSYSGIPLAKWEGFKDFIYYCQHSENAECTKVNKY